MDEIQAHVERAKRAYNAFKILSNNNLIEDAFSRGYYSIVHLGFALFIKNNLSLPKNPCWTCRKAVDFQRCYRVAR